MDRTNITELLEYRIELGSEYMFIIWNGEERNVISGHVKDIVNHDGGMFIEINFNWIENNPDIAIIETYSSSHPSVWLLDIDGTEVQSSEEYGIVAGFSKGPGALLDVLQEKQENNSWLETLEP